MRCRGFRRVPHDAVPRWHPRYSYLPFVLGWKELGQPRPQKPCSLCAGRGPRRRQVPEHAPRSHSSSYVSSSCRFLIDDFGLPLELRTTARSRDIALRLWESLLGKADSNHCRYEIMYDTKAFNNPAYYKNGKQPLVYSNGDS